MALPAIGVRQMIVAVDMARLARLRLVRSFEREFRARMVEGRRFPRSCSMAFRTVVIEICRNVIRIERLRKIVLVALITTCIGQIVIAVCVALLALRRLMCAGERELRRCMIECRRFPGIHCMTLQTVASEPACRVRRRLCVIVILLVALQTIVVDKIVIPIRMALVTGRRQMRSNQREIRRSVIERGRLPSCRCVALGAIVRELTGGMVRILRVLKIGSMALLAIGKDDCIIPSGMTLFALYSCMFSGQRQCGFTMVELRRNPGRT